MNIIYFGNVVWSSLWKRSQTISYHLQTSESIEKIFYLNTPVYITGLISRNIVEFKGISNKYAWKSVFPVNVSSKLATLTPLLFNRRNSFLRLNNLISECYGRYLVRKQKGKDLWLWIADFSPSRYVMYKKLIPIAKRIIIDMPDDILGFATNDPNYVSVSDFFRYCVARADIVLCANEHIYDKYNDNSGKFYVLNNGVDFSVIDKYRKTDNDLFSALKIKHPVVGYMGVIGLHRIDLNLVERLLKTYKEFSFVFLGMDDHHFLPPLQKKYPNCYYIPAVPYEKMIDSVAHFDAAIIPHQSNEHTKGNNLLKAYIYLALKVPIVSTSVSELDKIGDVIDIADNTKDFCDLVGAAIKQPNLLKLDKGYELARMNSWSSRMESLYSILGMKKAS